MPRDVALQEIRIMTSSSFGWMLFVDPNVLADIKRKRLEKYGYFI